MSTSILRSLPFRTSARRVRTSWLATGLVLFAAGAAVPAWGQVAGSVTINTIVDPTHPFNIFEPNIFDLIHPKVLTFDADVLSLTPGAVGILNIQFDWFDPSVPGFVLSPVFQHQIIPDPSGLPTHILEVFTIPFCPPEVSLHLFTQNGAFDVRGVFTHECIVPEPSSFVLGAFGLIGLAAWGWRRRKPR